MNASLRGFACATLLALLCASPDTIAADAAPAAQETAQQEVSPAERAYYDAVEKLAWVRGPTTVEVADNSKLTIPEGYRFLDTKNTDRFLELNQNLAGGTEVMIAPENLDWSAYLSFADEGYVKDDEKIDADALLKAMQEGAEAGNEERARRGWPALHVVGWAIPPAYSTQTRRLEWATLLQSEGGRSANFSTKVLSRRGHTTVVLVAEPEALGAARPQLEKVLAGYDFKEGERYADFVPGDKVATYGLAALVLGGAAAIATKKGLWAVIGAFLIGKAKLLIAGGVAAAAAVRKFFGGKKASDSH